MRRFPAARMAIIIFFRIAGSAHRALAASRILLRRAGLVSAARNFAPVIGSAHRAFAAARYLSRISGVGSDRELTGVRLIPLDRRKKWAVASRGASAQGLVWSGPKDRLQNMVNGSAEQDRLTVRNNRIENNKRTWSAGDDALCRMLGLRILDRMTGW